MYYEDLLETVPDTEFTSIENSFDNKKTTSAAVARKIDRNYEKFVVPFNKTWNDGRYYKSIVVELYGSGQTDSRIRNAVTGKRCSYLVGSEAENLFFKVKDSTGRKGRKYPLVLFYDSPEQYENHHFTSVSQQIKNKWQEKQLDARKRMQ
jgi:hypothetical protein